MIRKKTLNNVPKTGTKAVTRPGLVLPRRGETSPAPGKEGGRLSRDALRGNRKITEIGK